MTRPGGWKHTEATKALMSVRRRETAARAREGVKGVSGGGVLPTLARCSSCGCWKAVRLGGKRKKVGEDVFGVMSRRLVSGEVVLYVRPRCNACEALRSAAGREKVRREFGPGEVNRRDRVSRARRKARTDRGRGRGGWVRVSVYVDVWELLHWMEEWQYDRLSKDQQRTLRRACGSGLQGRRGKIRLTVVDAVLVELDAGVMVGDLYPGVGV